MRHRNRHEANVLDQNKKQKQIEAQMQIPDDRMGHRDRHKANVLDQNKIEVQLQIPEEALATDRTGCRDQQ